jgi:UDP-N-acetylmuramoyl-L-alanyl-D-glutamate--2,6-diaminopimelate ligase
LSVLLAGYAVVNEADDRDIYGLSMDSRKVQAGDLFLACTGQQARHGHEFIADAIQAGAVAVAYALDGDIGNEARVEIPDVPVKVPAFGIAQLGQQAGVIAARFYDYPSRDLFVVGITGTNGKTSCSQFIAQALNEDAPAGVIGTLGNGLYGKLQETSHTTPDAISLHGLLAEMRTAGATSVAMEVSSHALEQGRVNGVVFDAAVFTNLSRDHLDYHGDMVSYGRAKQRLFTMPELRYAIINADDSFGRELLRSLPANVAAIAYALGAMDDGEDVGCKQVVRGTLLSQGLDGLILQVTSPWGEARFTTRLLGRFNASNLLAVLATLVVSGVPFDAAIEKMSRLQPVPGRMECYGGRHGKPLVVVDYAHTPDALKQVLQSLREHCQNDLWVVFGCGGNRDRGKRPLMGEIAQRHADHVVLTDDNPRYENADEIIADIRAGLRSSQSVYVERDRAQAIAWAVTRATGHDVVLIAGKGHENYQLIGDMTVTFSDSLHVRNLLREAA